MKLPDDLPDELFDPDAYTGIVVTADQIRTRIAFVEKTLSTWKSNSGYAENLRVELWALNAAIDLIELSKVAVLEAAAEYGLQLSDDTRDRAVMVMCQQIARVVRP